MKCVLCNEEIKGDVVNGIALPYGNNPHPLADEGKCCDDCNMFKVIPARMERSYVDPVKCVEKKSDKPLSVVESQFNYVRKVVHSCETALQFGYAMAWAKDWTQRIAIAHPDKVKSPDILLSYIVLNQILDSKGYETT